MTTTKEDRMLADYLQFVKSQLDKCEHDIDMVRYFRRNNSTLFSGWKACAESYEQKLADSYESFDGIKNILHDTQKQLSEANSRNVMLVELLTRIDYEVMFDGASDLSSSVDEAITANSESVAAWEAEKIIEERLYLAECFRVHDTGRLASAEQIAKMLEDMANDVKEG